MTRKSDKLRQTYSDPKFIARRKGALNRKVRLKGLENLDTFDGMIAYAKQGKTNPLCDYIRAHRLSTEERYTLAWFIAAEFQHRVSGPHVGSKKPMAPGHVELCAAAIEVLDEKEKYRQQTKKPYVPASISKSIVEKAIEKHPMLKGRDDDLDDLVKRGRAAILQSLR